MRVKSTTSVFSDVVGAAFKFMSGECFNDKYKTAVCFTNYLFRWFRTMTPRQPNLALSKTNIDAYDDTVSSLNGSITFLSLLQVGKGAWKPFQTSAIISTTSYSEVSEFLFAAKGLLFICSGRFTQDCIENTFFVLRTVHQIPTLLQLKNDVKFVTVSQFTKCVGNGNYEKDGREFLSGFLDVLDVKTKEMKEAKEKKVSQCNHDLFYQVLWRLM